MHTTGELQPPDVSHVNEESPELWAWRCVWPPSSSSRRLCTRFNEDAESWMGTALRCDAAQSGGCTFSNL